MANELHAYAIEFGPFALDSQTGELTRAGYRLRLPGQSLQILVMLLEQAGQVVPREALRQRLWSGDTYVDFEQGLNNAIKRLREALGDSAEKPSYIETVRGVGYRFIGSVAAPIVPTAIQSEVKPAAHAEAVEPALLKWRRFLWFSLPVAAVVLLASAVVGRKLLRASIETVARSRCSLSPIFLEIRRRTTLPTP